MILMMESSNSYLTPTTNQDAATAALGTAAAGWSAADYPIGDGDGDIFVLPPSFVPGKWDVICQRGKECFEHGE